MADIVLAHISVSIVDEHVHGVVVTVVTLVYRLVIVNTFFKVHGAVYGDRLLEIDPFAHL